MKRPLLERADFVTTLRYGLRPACESAFAMLSARSCAGVFSGAGGGSRLMMKHPCALSEKRRQARSGAYRTGEGFSFRFDGMLTAMPME